MVGLVLLLRGTIVPTWHNERGGVLSGTHLKHLFHE
jgi:hypothetical protein